MEARAHLEEVRANAANFSEDLVAHIAHAYTADELRIIRTGQHFTSELTAKLVNAIMNFARKLFEANPDRINFL